MTVFDSSAVLDFLLDAEAAPAVRDLLEAGEGAAPDVLAFEVLAVLRRATIRAKLDDERAARAVDDLGSLQLELFASMPLRHRAWSLRENLTAADALFVALAEALDEPLATKDRSLARAVAEHAEIETIVI